MLLRMYSATNENASYVMPGLSSIFMLKSWPSAFMCDAPAINYNTPVVLIFHLKILLLLVRIHVL